MKISDLELKESVLTELSENDASKICGGADMFSIGGSAQDAFPRLQEAFATQQANSEQNTIALRNTFDQVAQSSRS